MDSKELSLSVAKKKYNPCRKCFASPITTIPADQSVTATSRPSGVSVEEIRNILSEALAKGIRKGNRLGKIELGTDPDFGRVLYVEWAIDDNLTGH